MLGIVKEINGEKKIIPLTTDTGTGAPADVVQDGNMHAVTSNAVAASINELQPVDVVQDGNMKSVTSNAVYDSINELQPVNSVSSGNMKSVTSNAVAASINELQPVNVVEGGNMSAVTSNAVFSYLNVNDVEVIAPEIIDIYGASISMQVTRFGHVVNINCYIRFYNNTEVSNSIFANGLPVPISIADSGRFYVSNNIYLEKDSSSNLADLKFDNMSNSVQSDTVILFSSFYFV